MNEIFVFGSNLAGRHGAGAALYARKHHGAIYGQGIGMQGNSYGIPTKDNHIKTLPITEVKKYIDQFVEFAETHPENHFQVTRVGCGLAGFTDKQIAPLFANSPSNCYFDFAWKPFLPSFNFWGNF